MDFLPVYADVRGCGDAQSYLIAYHAQDGDRNAAVDDADFARLPGKDQHNTDSL
jgi:hypothetical protein